MARRRLPAVLFIAGVATVLIVLGAPNRGAPSTRDNEASFLGQRAVTQPDLVTCDVWVAYTYYPSSLEDLRQKASAVVVARVVAVVQQPDRITEGHRNPSQRVFFEAVKHIEGDLGEQFRLWHYGTDTICQRGDPPYHIGEIYVLFVLPMETEPGTFYVPAPPARYQVVDDRLEPMRDENTPFAEALAGKTVAEFERILTRVGEP